jgi:hypothetical protein
MQHLWRQVTSPPHGDDEMVIHADNIVEDSPFHIALPSFRQSQRLSRLWLAKPYSVGTGLSSSQPFGSISYSKRCFPSLPSTACKNPHTAGLSILYCI